METNPIARRLAPRIRALHCGSFVSRGLGGHPHRSIGSHELILVSAGTLHMYEEDRRFAVAAGEALLLQAGRRHGGAQPYGRDLRFHWIHFGPPDARVLAGLPRHGPMRDAGWAEQIFRRILHERERGSLSPLRADLLLATLLAELAEGPPTSSVAANAFAARADEIIRLRFAEGIGASEIAAAVGCHPDHLARVYRRCYGRSPTDALHRARIAFGSRLLRETSSSIDEIAGACGFASAIYFRRIFRRLQGITPTAYRRLYLRGAVNTE